MKFQIPDFRFKILNQRCVTIVLSVCFFITLLCPAVFSEEKWSGVDEAVVKKIAKEHGREAWEPLINTDQGDLLLFVFLLAGTIGGFAAGYYWRSLMEGRSRKPEGGARSDGTVC